MAIKRNGKSTAMKSIDSDEGGPDSGDTQAEFSGHLRALEASFKAARSEMKRLERENAQLEVERQRLEMHTSDTTPSSKLRNLEKVTDLTQQLSDSREETRRLKSKIRKLQVAELKREQRELEEGVSGFGDAWTTKFREMKLLLRRFRGLVEETVLEDPANGEGPDCPICYTAMTTENASSAPCEHIYHTACLMEYSRAQGNPFECPECRKPVRIADLQRVQHTAESQWSELVDVALEWANIDKNRIEDEPETSDATTELGFIDDGEEGTALWEVTNEVDAESEAVAKPESDEELAGTSQTPSKKRKLHLDALVASRAAKRQKK